MRRSPRPSPSSLLALLAVVAAALSGCAAAPTASGPAVAPSIVPAETGTDNCATVDLSTPSANPVEISVGHGVAAEEQFWLQWADPGLAGATHYGRWYTIRAQPLNAPERLAAYQAGDLDAGSIGTTELVQARAQGLDLAAVASIVQEAAGSFNTSYVALADSSVRTPADLRGRTIGIVAPNSNTEYWAISAAVSAGLDPRRDVQYLTIPFPDQEQALRAGQIDVAVLVQPFAAVAQRNGGLVEVFTSLTGPQIDQELLVAWFDRQWIAEHPQAFCAWRADYLAATNAYLQDRRAAAQALIDAELLGADSLETYLAVPDWARAPDGAINLADLDTLIADMTGSGFVEQDATVPAAELVLPGYSLTT